MSNIKNTFTAWGKSQHQTPVRNEVLKSTILNHMPELSGATAKSGLPWLSFAFAGLAVIMIFIRPFASAPTQDMTVSSEKVTMTAGYDEPISADNLSMKVASDYYRMPSYNDEVAITDDREFLKINYRADIRTRQTGDMIKRAQTIVHAFDGRIDSMSSSKKYGQITFALPAEKFDAFQIEIQALTRGKFIVENISAHNVLPQKQIIERRTEEVTKQLADLRALPRTRAIDEKIKYLESDLNQLVKENQAVVDNVATVQGTISMRWISIPEIIALYVGPYWIAILFGVLALATFVINRVRTSRIVLPA